METNTTWFDTIGEIDITQNINENDRRLSCGSWGLVKKHITEFSFHYAVMRRIALN